MKMCFKSINVHVIPVFGGGTVCNLSHIQVWESEHFFFFFNLTKYRYEAVPLLKQLVHIQQHAGKDFFKYSWKRNSYVSR